MEKKDFKFLNNKNFVLLCLSGFISIIGTLMQDFALSLYIFKISGSALKFASVLIMSLLPNLILSPIAGVLVDRFDKKKIIVFIDYFRLILLILYSIIFIRNGGLTLIQIYILTICLSMSSIFYKPAQQTLLPYILDKDNLLKGTSIYTSITQTASLIAPALGGMIYSIYGLPIILIINAISFGISGFSKSFLNISDSIKENTKTTLKTLKNDLIEGFLFFKSNKLILNISITMFIVTIGVTSCTSIGYIYISKNVLHVSDFQYGLMGGFDVLGGLLGAVTISYFRKNFSFFNIVSKTILFSAVFYSILAIISSQFFIGKFPSNLLPYIMLLISSSLIAMLATLLNISIEVEIQQNVPLPIMGRVFTLFGIALNISSLIAQVIFGVLFDILSVPICVLISTGFLSIGFVYSLKHLNYKCLTHTKI